MLSGLLDNIEWAGRPDIPLRVFVDPSPFEDTEEVNREYARLCREKKVECYISPEWGCMQGLTEFMMHQTHEDWIIWVPDDVKFSKGGLWNEYAGVLTFGRWWVGGIQAPYWNAQDLVDMGVMTHKEQMLGGWNPESIPKNAFWDQFGLPRAYVNLNGAGFSLSRDLWKKMGGFPQITWRLDEYAGFQGWVNGMPIITLPGPPRVHYLGGTTSKIPDGKQYHSAVAWETALGCSIAQATGKIYEQMHKLPGGLFPEMLAFFNEGGSLL